MPRFENLVNSDVIVYAPEVDKTPMAAELITVDSAGLWLFSKSFNDQLAKLAGTTALFAPPKQEGYQQTIFFVPFVKIVYVLHHQMESNPIATVL
jgi:hypothetical protein